jgi:glycosyltransferase involved in cell wall biosynthesis
MPLVSVVMPSYNYDEFVSESIESVLGQDFDDLELIIVDDASTDASRQIIQKYAAEDTRIRVILHETNCGFAKTMNDGIETAKGEFVAAIDSDDVWAKDKLTKQLAVTASNENLIVWSEGEVIDRKGHPVGKSFSEFNGTVSRKKSGDISQELLRRNYIFGSTLLFKRTNLGEIRFDERLMLVNDWKFVLDLARKYEFYYIAEPLVQYRVHGNNTLAGLESRGSEPEAAKRRRNFHLDAIVFGQEALRLCDPASGTTKADIYAYTGYSYECLGDNKTALLCFLRAFRYNALSMSNLRGAPRFLKLVGLTLLNSGTRERNSLKKGTELHQKRR